LASSKAYFVIAIAILVGMVVAGIASSQPTTTSLTEEEMMMMEEEKMMMMEKEMMEKEMMMMEEAGQPSLLVSDQSVVDGQVVIDWLFLDKPGYIVIHMDLEGAPGPLIGNSELLSGSMTSVWVSIDAAQAGTGIFPMLHYDNGDGVYEFPGPDLPTVFDGNVVVKRINLS